MSGGLVLKLGGAAMRNISQFHRLAALICRKRAQFGKIAVVVSAMGDTTDQLLSLAHQIDPNPPHRERDMLITTGERVSSSLLAMALQRAGMQARSFTGSQAGILTTESDVEAKILDVQPWRLLPGYESGQVPVIAGFQGVSAKCKEITTLGRGGSDTSAVALGAALNASCVEFYKDVAGIFDKDPKENLDARLHRHLTFERALSIVGEGAVILHRRALHLAEANDLPLHLFGLPAGDWAPLVNQRAPGTLVSSDSQILFRLKRLRPRFESDHLSMDV